jgi:flavin reductase (DIM6/NTAB) family NADH-FMN oxidoreductase RutF
MVDFEPPLLALVVSDDNESFEMLQKSKECVLNIPTAPLLKKAVQCGTNSARDVPDKFTRFGLTPRPAATVKAPLIDECYANIECKVLDSHLAARYNMFFLKVTKAWVDPAIKQPTTIHHCGRGRFRIAGRTVLVKASIK